MVILKRGEAVPKRLTPFFSFRRHFTVFSRSSRLRLSTPTMPSQRPPSSWRRPWTTSWSRWTKPPVKWGWWEAWSTPSQRPWARWAWAPNTDPSSSVVSLRLGPQVLFSEEHLVSFLEGSDSCTDALSHVQHFIHSSLFISYFAKPVVPSLPVLHGGNGDAEGIIGYFSYKMEIIIHLPIHLMELLSGKDSEMK